MSFLTWVGLFQSSEHLKRTKKGLLLEVRENSFCLIAFKLGHQLFPSLDSSWASSLPVFGLELPHPPCGFLAFELSLKLHHQFFWGFILQTCPEYLGVYQLPYTQIHNICIHKHTYSVDSVCWENPYQYIQIWDPIQGNTICKMAVATLLGWHFIGSFFALFCVVCFFWY